MKKVMSRILRPRAAWLYGVPDSLIEQQLSEGPMTGESPGVGRMSLVHFSSALVDYSIPHGLGDVMFDLKVFVCFLREISLVRPLEITCITLWISSKDKLIVTSASEEVYTILSKKFMDLLSIASVGEKDHVSVLKPLLLLVFFLESVWSIKCCIYT